MIHDEATNQITLTWLMETLNVEIGHNKWDRGFVTCWLSHTLSTVTYESLSTDTCHLQPCQLPAFELWTVYITHFSHVNTHLKSAM